MKKFLLGLGLCFLSGSASAFELTYEKTASTWTVTGVTCSTGTAIEITQSISGYNLLNHRVQNQDSADAVWIGYNSSVSTSAASGLGERLDAGASGTWSAGYELNAKRAVQIYCKAADAAGAAGVLLSVAAFGYR